MLIFRPHLVRLQNRGKSPSVYSLDAKAMSRKQIYFQEEKIEKKNISPTNSRIHFFLSKNLHIFPIFLDIFKHGQKKRVI